MKIKTPKIELLNVPERKCWKQPKEPQGVPNYAQKTAFIDEFLKKCPEVSK
ncbi:MAG: hypothetical protein WC565_05095 [Parcubacteria group bacterium]